MNKSIAFIVLSCSLFLITNCATLKSDLIGQFSGPAVRNFNADKVSVCFVFSHFRQTLGYDAIPKLDNKYPLHEEETARQDIPSNVRLRGSEVLPPWQLS